MLDVKRQLSEAIKSPFYIRIKLERNKDHFASDWLGFISIILKGYLKKLNTKRVTYFKWNSYISHFSMVLVIYFITTASICKFKFTSPWDLLT